MIWLALMFALTALLYASVGFAGGSTYTALLVLQGTDVSLVPVLSLVCNIAVSAGSVWHFARKGLYRDTGIGPILLASAPAAFLGGLTPVSEPVLIGLLGSLLLLAGFKLGHEALVQSRDAIVPAARRPLPLALSFGAGVGYLSGIVGIGGGIFLAPLLHFVRWASARQIAAIASAYIAINSIAALAGKALVLNATLDWNEAGSHWPLLAAVVAGGFIGRRLASSWLNERLIKGLTAALILFVAGRLLLALTTGGR